MSSNIVQYIIVRSDLKSALGWPLGAIIAQCCHVATAIMQLHAGDDETTQTYLADLDNMHKVVLEAKDEAALLKLSTKLEENSIKHKLWMEQPENIPTCIAVKPYIKEDIHKHVKHLKLLRVKIPGFQSSKAMKVLKRKR